MGEKEEIEFVYDFRYGNKPKINPNEVREALGKLLKEFLEGDSSLEIYSKWEGYFTDGLHEKWDVGTTEISTSKTKVVIKRIGHPDEGSEEEELLEKVFDAVDDLDYEAHDSAFDKAVKLISKKLGVPEEEVENEIYFDDEGSTVYFDKDGKTYFVVFAEYNGFKACGISLSHVKYFALNSLEVGEMKQ